MPTNPFTDVWHFLTATTSDYLHQGNWRYLILALFWALLLVSIAVALQNWREDPAPRTGRHFGIWSEASSAALGSRGWCGNCRYRGPAVWHTGPYTHRPNRGSGFTGPSLTIF